MTNKTLSFKDFVDTAWKIAGCPSQMSQNSYDRLKPVTHRKQVTKDSIYYEEWVVGGVTGGNCWGNEASIPVTADEEPEFDSIDMILEHFVPQITFLQYKQLGKLVNAIERTEYEYYGNSYDKRIKYIKLGDLYDFILQYL